MKDIGILYIALGKYSIFWPKMYENCEQFFIPTWKKHYYVFSDNRDLNYKNNENVTVIFQNDMGWPKDTLLRFEMFDSISDRLKDETDFLFFFNANLMPVRIIDETFLPRKEKLLVALHPGYAGMRNPMDYPYCRDKMSTAYIPYDEGKIYVQGALNGGLTDAYLEMVHILHQNVEEDLSKGIVATVHDESHLNRYILGRDDVKIVGSEYIYPEGYNLWPLEPVIISRDKSKYFDVDKIKLSSAEYLIFRIKKVMIMFRERLKAIMPKSGGKE